MPNHFTLQSSLHVGIIMDGNGRWATGRGLPRIMGHRSGVEAARHVVEAAPECGIGILTLFAFSSGQLAAPGDEVDALMRLMATYLEKETARCVAKACGWRSSGGATGWTRSCAAPIAQAEAATADGQRLWLRMAVDYSAATPSSRRTRADRSFTGSPGAPHGAARRPVDPHRRRAAAERLSVVGIGLRGTGLHAHDVAGFWRGRPGSRGARVPHPASAASARCRKSRCIGKPGWTRRPGAKSERLAREFADLGQVLPGQVLRMLWRGGLIPLDSS